MIRTGHTPRLLAPLFLTLLLGGCGDGFYMPAAISMDAGELPDPVAQSVAKNWPKAKVTSAKRIYSLDSDSWGDYHLMIEVPQRAALIYPILSADGKVKWDGGFLEDPSMETEGQRSLELRDRAH